MRKTTEELAREAGIGRPMSGDKRFETFRRLCIENERESVTPFCYFASDAKGNIDYSKTDRFSYGSSGGEPLFTFPPAAIDKVMKG